MDDGTYSRLLLCAVPLSLVCRSYPYGAADESATVVDLQHTLKQLVTGGLVGGKLPLIQVHGLRDTPRKVHQCIGRVSSIQRFIAAVQPDSKGQTRLYIVMDSDYLT